MMFFTSQNKMAEKIIPNLVISQKYKASRLLDINDYSALTGKISRGISSQIRLTRAHAKDSQMRVGGQKALRGCRPWILTTTSTMARAIYK